MVWFIWHTNNRDCRNGNSEALALSEWHLITSEYPPQPGGVSDYTRLVASALAAAGDTVHTWCPPSERETPMAPGVEVHRELGRIAPADLYRVGQMLNRFSAPRRLLVQWVPHGYGHQSVNLPFCLWLWKRVKLNGDSLEIMVHEPYLAFGEGSWKQNAAAMVHRLMVTLLLNAARHVWISIPAWESCWRPYAFGRCVPFAWLPIPSCIPVTDDPAGVAALRTHFAPTERYLVGHFGTYGKHIATPLMALLPLLLQASSNIEVLLLGRGGEIFREELVGEHPHLANRIHAAGPLNGADTSRYLSVCDVMIQPYPDGVSSRRTSVMAGLAHGLPIISTTGPLTESLWIEDGAVSLAPAGEVSTIVESVRRLLADATERKRMSAAARALYRERFDVTHTIAALRNNEVSRVTEEMNVAHCDN